MNAADTAFIDFDRLRPAEMLPGMLRRRICSAKSPLHFFAATGGQSIRRKKKIISLIYCVNLKHIFCLFQSDDLYDEEKPSRCRSLFFLFSQCARRSRYRNDESSRIHAPAEYRTISLTFERSILKYFQRR
jgi:hypothetical protein